jgi:flagellar motility protein MotE (MotC chaperone)
MSRSFAIVATLAVLLGLAVAFGTLFVRWIPLAEAFKQRATASASAPALVPKSWDFWTLEIGKLSEDLLKERQAVHEREKDLAAWQKQLETEKTELVRVREQIEAIRDEIDKTVITLMEAEKPNIKSLSRSYAAMKATQAAAIFRKTNDDIIVKILSLMKPDIVAKILSEMASETNAAPSPAGEITGSARAARITEMLRLLKQENPKAGTP